MRMKNAPQVQGHFAGEPVLTCWHLVQEWFALFLISRKIPQLPEFLFAATVEGYLAFPR